MTTFERYERLGRCECGQYLTQHPPLPKVKPLRSWHAARSAGNPNLARPNPAQAASHERFMRLRG